MVVIEVAAILDPHLKLIDLLFPSSSYLNSAKTEVSDTMSHILTCEKELFVTHIFSVAKQF